MSYQNTSNPDTFTSFGQLLYFLRRRAHLKQRDLAIATGYSEAQISRLEQNRRLPDQTTLAALFIPALDLEHEPAWATRLLALAESARNKQPVANAAGAASATGLESVPPPAFHEVPRPQPLARLRTLCAAERRVGLCGLAGVGKTTLAATFAREYTSGPVFWLTLSAQVNTSAEVLVHRLAEFLYAHGQTHVAPLLHSGERNEPSLRFDRQLALLGTALAALSAQGTPPLLCLDNVYLVQYEEQAVQVIQHLIVATPAALLLVSRESLPFPHLAQLLLGGLESNQGQALLQALVGSTTTSVGLATRLMHKTAGNPMLLRLVAGQLLDERINQAEFVQQLEQQPQITAYVVDAVQRRLSPAAWQLLALAALMRRPVDLYDETLARLCAEHGAAVPSDTITELQQHLLVANPSQAAPPPLLRDAIAVTLLADQGTRRKLHRIAAEWAEVTYNDLVLAAFHFNRAGDLNQAAETLIGQAERLGERGEASAAARLVDELLVQAKRGGRTNDEQVGRLLTLRGDLLINTLNAVDGETSYRAALAYTQHPAIRARITAKLAFSLVQRGYADEALRHCQEARLVLTDADALLLTDLAIAEGWAYRLRSEYDALLEAARQGLAFADELASTLPQIADRSRALIYANIGYFHYTRRQLDQATAQIERAISTAEQAGQVRLARRYRSSAAHILLAHGNLRGTERMVNELLVLAREAGDSLSVEYLLCLAMITTYLRGNLEDAAATFDGAWALRQTLGLFAGAPVAEAFYPTVLVGIGRLDEARDMLDTLLARLKPTGDGREWGYNQTRRAVLHLLDGEVVSARQLLSEVLALPAATHDPKLHADAETYLALAHLVAGNSAQAQLLLATDRHAGPWAQHERTAARALCALAQNDQTQAAHELARLERETTASGHGVFGRIATQIATHGLDPNTWLRLFFVAV